jgi:hypothetical protein
MYSRWPLSNHTRHACHATARTETVSYVVTVRQLFNTLGTGRRQLHPDECRPPQHTCQAGSAGEGANCSPSSRLVRQMAASQLPQRHEQCRCRASDSNLLCIVTQCSSVCMPAAGEICDSKAGVLHSSSSKLPSNLLQKPWCLNTTMHNVTYCLDRSAAEMRPGMHCRGAERQDPSQRMHLYS